MKLCDLAINETDDIKDWVIADPWESLLKSFVSFEFVLGNLDLELSKNFPDQEFQIFYLCGADLLVRCGIFFSIGKFGVVGIGRPGSTHEIRKVLKRTVQSTLLFHFLANNDDDVSSTEIRKKMVDRESISELTCKSVELYIKNNKLV